MEMGGLRKRPKKFPCKLFSSGTLGRSQKRRCASPTACEGKVRPRGQGGWSNTHPRVHLHSYQYYSQKQTPLSRCTRHLEELWVPWGCSICRAVLRTLGKELEEELASLCVDRTLERGGGPWPGNVGLYREPRKAPDPCNAQSGPVRGEGLAVTPMGLGGRIRADGVMEG